MSARSVTSLVRRHWRLLALAAVPLVALAASVRDRLGARAPAAAHIVFTPAIIVLLAVAAGGAVWLGVIVSRGPRRRRRRGGAEPARIVTWQAGRRAQLLALLVLIPIILAPIALVIVVSRSLAGSDQSSPPSVQSVSPSVTPARTAPTHGASGPDTGTMLLVGAVLVAAGAAGLVAARRRRRPIADVALPDPVPTLQQAVDESLRRGIAALATTDDVRLAIVRCYAAMQRRLDEAGLRGSPVRTPTEMLGAAIEQRLLPAGPATALTRLFERARFSSDPLTAADRDAAGDALEALRVSGALR